MTRTPPTLGSADLERLVDDARDGLWADPPHLPARWFYDELGSRLFDDITRLPEYYPTRAETAILREHADEVVAAAGAATLVELGSGTSTKTRLLLDALVARFPAGAGFVPVDVSVEILEESAATIAAAYPTLTVTPVVADFGDPLGDLPGEPGARLLVFLGGTIGNFEVRERADFLDRVRDALVPGDRFLLGADLVKDVARLEAAYDDAAGVTAAFDLNLVTVLARELGATGLAPSQFRHVARWNPTEERVEMWLRVVRPVRAHLAALDKDWSLDVGDELLTEISTKFRLPALQAELAAHGLPAARSWTDPDGDYSLTLAEVG